MFIKLKDLTGSTVLINPRHIVLVGQAADSKTKQPILGRCVVICDNGMTVEVASGPEVVSDAVEKQLAMDVYGQ